MRSAIRSPRNRLERVLRRSPLAGSRDERAGPPPGPALSRSFGGRPFLRVRPRRVRRAAMASRSVRSSTSIARCCRARAARSSREALRDCRTLIADRTIPGEACCFRRLQPRRREPPVDACSPGRPPLAKGWGQSRRSTRPREKAAEVLLEPRCSPTPRRSSRNTDAAGRLRGARDDDAVRLGRAACRPARSRRRDRHALRRADDGKYDGTIDGEFVWGKGKLAAVQHWAGRTRCRPGGQLRLLRQLCTTRRCCPRSATRSRSTPTRACSCVAIAAAVADRSTSTCRPASRSSCGIEPQQVIMAFARPELVPYARFDIEGVDHIPAEGPAIIVGNHRSYFDPSRWARCSPSGAGPSASSERRKCSTCRSSVRSRKAVRWHPRRPGHRLRRAAAGGGRCARRR